MLKYIFYNVSFDTFLWFVLIRYKKEIEFLNSFISNQIEGHSNDKKSLKTRIFFLLKIRRNKLTKLKGKHKQKWLEETPSRE